MAVFTNVDDDELVPWLSGFEVGELVGFEGISAGIENSNYFVETTDGRFVLTLFERLSAAELPFYLGLMKHLARHDIACPDPIARRDGKLLSTLAGKPAALVTRLAGRDITSPGTGHCTEVGTLLARMHVAALDYPGTLPNLRGLQWWKETAPKVQPFLDEAQANLLADELQAQQRFAESAVYAALQRTAVHADLFRDNVLFESGATRPGAAEATPPAPRLGGVIDFYFAGVDTWCYDLAVTLNDWCIDAEGRIDTPRAEALLAAYRAQRTPIDAERDAWPMMLRAAALRFWISRLYDLHLPRPAQMVTPKDPSAFERILRARRDEPVPELG